MNWEGEGLRTNNMQRRGTGALERLRAGRLARFSLVRKGVWKGGGKRDEGLAEVSKNEIGDAEWPFG